MTAVSVTVAASWTFGVIGLLLVASMITDFGDSVAMLLLRGGRAVCGVMILYLGGVAGLCLGHSDPDIYVAFSTGNHLFSSDSSLMYCIFAIMFALSVGSAIVCVVVAQHGTLTVIDKRIIDKGRALPRTAWNVNIVLILLFELQKTMQHNIDSAFAVRPILASWQTLAGLPTLMLFDLISVKMIHVNRLWSLLLVVTFHLLVISAWTVTVFFSDYLHSTDAMYVNIAFAAILIICMTSDIMQIANAMRSHDSPSIKTSKKLANTVATTLAAVDYTNNGYDLFNMPVRSGNRSILQKKGKSTIMPDIRSKKSL